MNEMMIEQQLNVQDMAEGDLTVKRTCRKVSWKMRGHGPDLGTGVGLFSLKWGWGGVGNSHSSDGMWSCTWKFQMR